MGLLYAKNIVVTSLNFLQADLSDEDKLVKAFSEFSVPNILVGGFTGQAQLPTDGSVAKPFVF